MKKCNKCQNLLDLNCFSKDSDKKDGFSTICKGCRKIYGKKYYNEKIDVINVKRKQYRIENKEKLNNIANQYYQDNKEILIIKRKLAHRSNPLRSMLNDAKKRAKSKNIEFDLKIENLLIPNMCPVLGIPLKVSETGVLSFGSPTIDRIDNSKGYTHDNVIIISHRANSIKRDATLAELIKITDFYFDLQNKDNNI